MRLYILDRKLRPLPIGVSGELYVGGIGVGRGYLNDIQRTAEAFVTDPFSDEAGMRLYKTGDLARYLPDGNIEFLGRVDHQVKIRGYRIELGEIEALLRQYSGVQDVVVIVREDIPGDKSLAAYVVTSTDITSNGLRNYLKEKLPDYMIPAAFVLLESLPLTPNGKVDRRALPVPEYSRSERDENFVAPTLPIHQQLRQIWEELLDARPIGIQDNFFDLGGHSLLVVRLIDRIEQVFGKKIELATLLASPTIEQMANALEHPEEIKSASIAEAVQAGNSKRPPFEHRSWLSSIKTLLTRPRSLGS
jgi:acyl carrier protein